MRNENMIEQENPQCVQAVVITSLLQGKSILDACCGSRMFWFDKSNKNVLFADIRQEEHTLCDGRPLKIQPDIGRIQDLNATRSVNILIIKFSFLFQFSIISE